MTASKQIVGHFVWVRGLKGAVPEKWPFDGAIGEAKVPLAKYPLTIDLWSLTIPVLAQAYPAPAIKMEDAT